MCEIHETQVPLSVFQLCYSLYMYMYVHNLAACVSSLLLSVCPFSYWLHAHHKTACTSAVLLFIDVRVYPMYFFLNGCCSSLTTQLSVCLLCSSLYVVMLSSKR